MHYRERATGNLSDNTITDLISQFKHQNYTYEF
jgi:hypothetical protein